MLHKSAGYETICSTRYYVFQMSVAKTHLKKIVYNHDGLMQGEESYWRVTEDMECKRLENEKWSKCNEILNNDSCRVYEWKGNNDQIAYCRVEWNVRKNEKTFRIRLFFKRVEE